MDNRCVLFCNRFGILTVVYKLSQNTLDGNDLSVAMITPRVADETGSYQLRAFIPTSQMRSILQQITLLGILIIKCTDAYSCHR